LANPTTYSAAGQTIRYSYTVNNTENQKIIGVAITDDHITGAVTVGDLETGQNATVTALYQTTSADVTAGSVTNSAYATGTYGSSTVTSNTVSVKVIYAPASSSVLKLTKSANTSTYNIVGQKITYIYNISNSGNVQVSGLKVVDNKSIPVTLTSTTVAAGANVTGTAIYTIKATDITNGSVTNSAIATGTANGNQVQSTPATATVTCNAAPALTITKSANTSTYNIVGQKITYTYNISNSGNVPVSNIVVKDSKMPTTSISIGTLQPGTVASKTAIYKITSADITAGSVINIATANGTFNGIAVTSQATATIKYMK
jgi:uncharacterized repeat protein (TIGR01451 family)